MVTDRSTTAGLVCFLAVAYPAQLLLWQLLLGLDLSSHYLQMYASLAAGAASHKAIDPKQHWLLRAYYHRQSVLFAACAGNELFYLGLYLLHHHQQAPPLLTVAGHRLSRHALLTLAMAPVWAFKQCMNLVQLVGASRKLVALEHKAK